MKNKNLTRLLKHDFYGGILFRWRFWVTALLLFLFFFFSFFVQTKAFLQRTGTEGSFGILDLMMWVFFGNPPLEENSFSGIDLSIIWVAFHTLLLAFTAFYPREELKKSAALFIVRVKSKRMWWLSKFCWCFFAVLCYFLLFLAAAALFTVVFGDISSPINRELTDLFLQINPDKIPLFTLWQICFLMPLAACIGISLLQASLSLFIKPIYCFVLAVCFLLAGACLQHPLLLYNFTMVVRARAVTGEGEITAVAGYILGALAGAVSFLLGAAVIERKDII